jgi:hypothetical protein
MIVPKPNICDRFPLTSSLMVVEIVNVFGVSKNCWVGIIV